VEVPAGIYKFYVIEGEYEPLRGNPYRIGARAIAGSFYDGWRVSCSFIGHIGRLKIESFLNVKHSLIAFIQYNSASDAFLTNLRYRFNPSEGHDLYIVYDEGLNADREREIPILPLMKNRTIMLKYSYTFKVGL